MKLQVAKWGKCLVLRILAQSTRRFGINEGDQVQLNPTTDGGISVHAAKWGRKAFVHSLEATREAMPMTESVMEALRSGSRY
jgi:antitoxin MazE